MNIHDHGYKKLFSNQTIFRQLIETFVDEPWVKDLDFSQAETVDKSFIDEHYKETESDLIYRVRLQGRDVYIYVLMEFQSTVDRNMAVRVLHYVSSLYMDFIRSGQKFEKLPAIFPIVLYNGDRRWTAPVNINELIDQQPTLGRYALNFEYFKIAENEFSHEQLLQIRNIVSTLFLTESHYEIERLYAELLNVFEQEEDRQAASLFLNWFRQLRVHGRISSADYDKLETTYTSIEEAKSMLSTTFAKERERIRNEVRNEVRKEVLAEGIGQGIEQGIEQGIDQKTREIVHAMQAKGFELAIIADITSLTIAQVQDLLDTEEELAEDPAAISDDAPTDSDHGSEAA